MNKILFKHELSDSWQIPLTSIKIFDCDNNNVVIDNDKYTISNNYIEKIKKVLNNPNLYKQHDILLSPVLDGTIHDIIFSSKKDKKIECSNLWFWNEEGAFDNYKEDEKKENIEYTKLVVDTINTIQNILYENNINFYILDIDEVDE